MVFGAFVEAGLRRSAERAAHGLLAMDDADTVEHAIRGLNKNNIPGVEAARELISLLQIPH
jgi:hypothetical protein